jgi:hypothetical protein
VVRAAGRLCPPSGPGRLGNRQVYGGVILIVPHAAIPRPFRRLGAWLVAAALDRRIGVPVVLAFAAVHVVAWTLILSALKWRQDIHGDTAEAYAWGARLLFGYGKHPPLSAWVARAWFSLFPTTDWAAYALAMTVTAAAMLVVWMTALRVVERRRALVALVLLAIYPIFNFKGYKYNADLLELAIFPLIVLTFLIALERRTAVWGFALGLAAGAGLLTKYWALLPIGAVGIAALMQPDRWRFLRSPAPYVAVAACAAVFAPHLWWLMSADMVSINYVVASYSSADLAVTVRYAATYLLHHLALFVPVAIAAIVAFGPTAWWRPAPAGAIRPRLVRPLRIVLLALVVAPVIAAVVIGIRMKSDWGIPLFFLAPLIAIATSRLSVQRIAVARVAAVWAAFVVAMLLASPMLAGFRPVLPSNPNYHIARKATELWHERTTRPLAIVAGFADVPFHAAFYSPDRPTPMELGDPFSVRFVTAEDAVRTGFVGICRAEDARCLTQVGALSPVAERVEIVIPDRGSAGVPAARWTVFITLPAT